LIGQTMLYGAVPVLGAFMLMLSIFKLKIYLTSGTFLLVLLTCVSMLLIILYLHAQVFDTKLVSADTVQKLGSIRSLATNSIFIGVFYTSLIVGWFFSQRVSSFTLKILTFLVSSAVVSVSFVLVFRSLFLTGF
jgi:hypothetical protein